MKRIAVVAILLCLAVLAVPSALGQLVINPSTLVYGRTYSEWSGAWQQWALSIPVAQHPLFDNGDCSVGQSGSVWFLGGKFCALNNPNCGTNHVVRSCSVPAGKALYIPVLNAEWSVLEMNDPKFQIDDLRALAALNIDGATNLSFDIDGAAVPHLKRDFRIQSPAFVFTIPDDNLFNAVGEGPYPGGAYFPGLDDGVYVMLAPLRTGSHIIHFHGYLPAFNFTLDITYNLTVAK
jgi:hypothetical protein